ncbi:MAG: ABC transporter ATP-binding protein [Butyrivibrio sp.]|nr:ABC transporter ATP-binding protein [Muribaculum sp.]MCM1553800.1 ABC transporter ATP-binding protein [Butyrivibrio sp.]
MEHVIQISHVNKFYGKKQALKDVSLTIEQGMFGLLGRNGAGKTTLMKLLATLHGKASGTISVCGIPVERAKEVRSITGYLPQEFSMYPNMRVYECMDYLGALSGMTGKERRERIPMLLKRVNLEEQAKSRVKSLSGGMRRRLGIAQALLHDPRVLIVDEPTAGLDPEERIRFRNLLCEVAKDRIVLLSTHIVGDIEATCEQIAILNEGEILWRGTVTELIHNAAGKVFAARLHREALPRVQADYIVTGLKTGEELQVRIVSESRPQTTDEGGYLEEVESVEPSCEDAYMYCLLQNGYEVTGSVMPENA